MPERLVSTTCLGNLNDPSYELLLRRELGGVFEVDELLLDWDQADARLFVGVTELGRTIDVRLDTADGGRLADGDVLAIDRSGMVPVAVVVRLRSAEVYLVEVRPHGSDCARTCVLGDRQHACAALPGRLRMIIPCACIRRCNRFWAACSGASGAFGSRWSLASSMPVDALHRARRMLL